MENITPRNNKLDRHGYWEVYWTNGNIAYKGYYINGEQVGYWEYYKFNGELEEQIFYA